MNYYMTLLKDIFIIIYILLNFFFFFYGGITPIIFIYLINLKKKFICKIIILKIKNYNKIIIVKN